MQLKPTLFCAGNAESALNHYGAALGVSAAWGAKVLYGSVRCTYGEVNVMDAPPGREGTPGSNFAIAIDVDNEERAAQIFARLAAGGAVLMPFDTSFFARKFGMANDKFGVRWMVQVPAEQTVTL